MATATRLTRTVSATADAQRAEARPHGPNRNLFKTGDRLPRQEFERRYALMPHVKKAELIEGMVVMEEHVHYDAHGNPHARLIGWLTHYAWDTPGVEIADNATVRLDETNEPQPDVMLRVVTGGRSRNDEDDYIDGAPELVAEIAASSVRYDLHAKRDAYARNGVLEYIVWRTLDGEIDWFALADGEFHPIPADQNGVIHSRAFPGLALATAALVEGDFATVKAALTDAMATKAHAAFVAKLRRQAAS